MTAKKHLAHQKAEVPFAGTPFNEYDQEPYPTPAETVEKVETIEVTHTAVIAEFTLGSHGPNLLASVLREIANYGKDGEYKFPNGRGETTKITVENL